MIAFFATMVARLAISPVVPLIVADFDITNTAIGLALSGMWVAYALTQFPSGILTDRVGEKPVVLLAVGGTAVGSLLLAVAPVFGVFVACTIVIGLMAGLHYTPATVLLSRLFDNVGTAIGIHSLGSPLAGLLAPIAAAWIGFRYGWRPAVAIGAVAAIPVFLLVLWRIRPAEPRNPDGAMRDSLDRTVIVELLTRRKVAFTLAIMIAGTFVWQGIASFLPTFVINYHGRTATLAAAAFSAYFVIQGATLVVVGAYADRYGRDLAIASCMLTGTVGFLVVLLGSGLAWLAVGVVLVAVGMSSYPAMLARLMDELAEAEAGTGLGLVRTVAGVVGASGSVAVGLLADLFGWGPSFSFLGALLFVVVCLLAANRAFALGY